MIDRGWVKFSMLLIQTFVIITLIFYAISVKPPNKLGKDELESFTMNGTIPILYFYVDDSLNGEVTHYKFSNAYISKLMEASRNLLLKVSNYFENLRFDETILEAKLQAQQDWAFADKKKWIYLAVLYYKSIFRDSHVAVFGSSDPWVESLCLALNSSSVVTFEYNNLTFNHSLLNTRTLSQLKLDLNECSQEKDKCQFLDDSFDVVFALSSFDHDGLGRYTDPINPYGDIEAMKLVHKLLKPGGIFYFSAPLGEDLIVFNTLRRYGNLRLPYVLESFSERARVRVHDVSCILNDSNTDYQCHAEILFSREVMYLHRGINPSILDNDVYLLNSLVSSTTDTIVSPSDSMTTMKHFVQLIESNATSSLLYESSRYVIECFMNEDGMKKRYEQCSNICYAFKRSGELINEVADLYMAVEISFVDRVGCSYVPVVWKPVMINQFRQNGDSVCADSVSTSSWRKSYEPVFTLMKTP